LRTINQPLSEPQVHSADKNNQTAPFAFAAFKQRREGQAVSVTAGHGSLWSWPVIIGVTYSAGMAAVEDELIAQALDAFGVEDGGPIGAEGGQKAVRRVTRGDENLVLKVIAVGSSAPDALRRAEREVDLLASLDSPHVVKVASELLELEDPPRGAAWLEEYLDGEDLTARLTSAWTWEAAVDLGLQVGKGLAAGHAAGVVHRDLSSNNVRRLSNGIYKVMDFGFARHTLRSGLTVAGQPGTRGFLTPEHLNSYSGGPMAASDVFGLGALMYAALTGDLPIPYRGDDDEYLHRLAMVEIIDIGTRRPDLTPERQAFIRRCLHRQPARRFRNGTKLVAALEGVA
jgi:serine/threonine protein kinase